MAKTKISHKDMHGIITPSSRKQKEVGEILTESMIKTLGQVSRNGGTETAPSWMNEEQKLARYKQLIACEEKLLINEVQWEKHSGLLVEYLNEGKYVSPSLARFIADVLSGKVKLKAGRPNEDEPAKRVTKGWAIAVEGTYKQKLQACGDPRENLKKQMKANGCTKEHIEKASNDMTVLGPAPPDVYNDLQKELTAAGIKHFPVTTREINKAAKELAVKKLGLKDLAQLRDIASAGVRDMKKVREK
jgi:hypothetical protein